MLRTALVIIALQFTSVTVGVVHAGEFPLAPELTHHLTTQWLNSPPVTLAAMRGKPVLIEFWTFDCINCLRSIDWMKSIEQRKANDGLVIVSVHTPELAHEKQPENVRAAVAKLGITYPVMLDTDYSYWKAMHNQYWPAFYLLDANGRIAAKHFGELHVGERDARQFESDIDRALNAVVKDSGP